MLTYWVTGNTETQTARLNVVLSSGSMRSLHSTEPHYERVLDAVRDGVSEDEFVQLIDGNIQQVANNSGFIVKNGVMYTSDGSSVPSFLVSMLSARLEEGDAEENVMQFYQELISASDEVQSVWHQFLDGIGDTINQCPIAKDGSVLMMTQVHHVVHVEMTVDRESALHVYETKGNAGFSPGAVIARKKSMGETIDIYNSLPVRPLAPTGESPINLHVAVSPHDVVDTPINGVITIKRGVIVSSDGVTGLDFKNPYDDHELETFTTEFVGNMDDDDC